ncbi:helix-turn-helix transcriptional regulator [Glaciimonas soli]|uniref:Helix-turn-helix domain-containing protein n=1 Tax=Glaciimonas soli TaxID=2590999 RepID=A0A843YUX6_9BURK|nr:helix-turn-helix transcriptional regulator [Glaciimonas soli]MQR01032.1 helix-turn-helix domain-containing protein [Glaciimonas soli]
MTTGSTKRIICSRAGIGTSAHIVQQQELLFTHLVIDQPMLIVVLQGAKTLRSQETTYQLRAGEAIVIAGGRSFDVINHLSPQGRYEACWLSWDSALIAEHASVYDKASIQSDRKVSTITQALPLRHIAPSFMDAINAAMEAIRDQDGIPDAIAKHRLSEVLLWLSLHNARLSCTEVRTLSGKLRLLLSSAPGKSWAAPDIAQQVAMSEATLRRHLAAEDTTLSELLMDVRMSFALGLLQATDKPIAQIAFESGYESASRFAIRFRTRFGFPPTAIRGHRRRPNEQTERGTSYNNVI